MKQGAAMKNWLWGISLMILGGGMSACAMGDKTSWKEEVMLHDGTKIVVERTQTYGGYAEPASTERDVAKEEWVFRTPGSGEKVVWKSDFRRPPEGDSLMLLQINFLDGVPYVATSPAGCLSYNHWKRPNPPYVFFKYEGKAWLQIPLSAFPIGFKNSNVAVGIPDKANRGGLLTVDTIKEENRLLEPYLREIVRAPLKPGSVGVSCPELVRIEGGWASPGGAKSPIPITPAR
jgi:hypothetical protein